MIQIKFPLDQSFVSCSRGWCRAFDKESPARCRKTNRKNEQMKNMFYKDSNVCTYFLVLNNMSERRTVSKSPAHKSGFGEGKKTKIWAYDAIDVLELLSFQENDQIVIAATCSNKECSVYGLGSMQAWPNAPKLMNYQYKAKENVNNKSFSF